MTTRRTLVLVSLAGVLASVSPIGQTPTFDVLIRGMARSSTDRATRGFRATSGSKATESRQLGVFQRDGDARRSMRQVWCVSPVSSTRPFRHRARQRWARPEARCGKASPSSSR